MVEWNNLLARISDEVFTQHSLQINPKPERDMEREREREREGHRRPLCIPEGGLEQLLPLCVDMCDNESANIEG